MQWEIICSRTAMSFERHDAHGYVAVSGLLNGSPSLHACCNILDYHKYARKLQMNDLRMPSLEAALAAKAVLAPSDRPGKKYGPCFELRNGGRTLQW